MRFNKSRNYDFPPAFSFKNGVILECLESTKLLGIYLNFNNSNVQNVSPKKTNKNKFWYRFNSWFLKEGNLPSSWTWCGDLELWPVERSGCWPGKNTENCRKNDLGCPILLVWRGLYPAECVTSRIQKKLSFNIICYKAVQESKECWIFHSSWKNSKHQKWSATTSGGEEMQ